MAAPFENDALTTTFIMEVDGVASEVEAAEGLLKVKSNTTTKTDPLTGRRQKIVSTTEYEDVVVTFREHGGTAVLLWNYYKAKTRLSFTMVQFAQDRVTVLATVTAVDCEISEMSGFEGLNLESDGRTQPKATLIVGEYTSVV